MKRRDLLLAAGLSPLMPVRTFANVPLSPYGDHHINSYCHAWSCTPSYFIRGRALASARLSGR